MAQTDLKINTAESLRDFLQRGTVFNNAGNAQDNMNYY